LKRILVFGYGNPDRQDDGVAWHVLVALAQRLGWQAPATIDEEFTPPSSATNGQTDTSADGNPDLRYDLQLTPEFAEIIAGYQRVCFIDAHTGNIPDEINVVEVKGEFQRSPFTHHMTPATCLAMAQSLYGGSPQAILVSVRGYEFGFVQSLSARTQELADQAASRIYDWLAA
jgi:Ni,Fe-hydrogenase maturation factor